MFSSHICDGCADGNFFYSGYGMNGGCIACSSPCTEFQDETITCSTKHDRTCTVKGTVLTILFLSKFISAHYQLRAHIIGFVYTPFPWPGGFVASCINEPYCTVDMALKSKLFITNLSVTKYAGIYWSIY